MLGGSGGHLLAQVTGAAVTKAEWPEAEDHGARFSGVESRSAPSLPSGISGLPGRVGREAIEDGGIA